MQFGRLPRHLKLAIAEKTGSQKFSNLLGHGVHACGTHTIAWQNLSIWQPFNQVLTTRLKSATAKGAERHNLLAAQVNLIKQGGNGGRIGPEPDGIAKEDDVIIGDIRFQGINFGSDAFLAVGLATVNRCLERRVVGLYKSNLLDVGMEARSDFLGHGLGV